MFWLWAIYSCHRHVVLTIIHMYVPMYVCATHTWCTSGPSEAGRQGWPRPPHFWRWGRRGPWYFTYIQMYMDPKYRLEVFRTSCRNTFNRCTSFIQGRSHQYSWFGLNKTTFAFPALVDERLRISSVRSHQFNSYLQYIVAATLCCRVTPFQ